MFIEHGPLFEMFLYVLVTLFILWLVAPSSKDAAPVVEDNHEVDLDTDILPPFESHDVRSFEEIERDRQEIEAASLQEDEEMREETALDVLREIATELHQQPIEIDSTSPAPRLGWEVETQPDYTTPRLEIVEEAPQEVADPLAEMTKTRLKNLAARLNKQQRIEGYSKMEPDALRTAIRNHPHYTPDRAAS